MQKRGTGRWPVEDYETLLNKKTTATSRLEEITGGKPVTKTTVPELKFAHWDYLLKEAKSMATGFAGERKGHNSMRKKLAKAVMGHFRQLGTREERMAREQQAALRKNASKVGGGGGSRVASSSGEWTIR